MNEKLSLLSELIKLANADKKLRENEYLFLQTVAKSLDVSQEDFENLFEENIELTPPKSEFDRILQFHRLVLMMNIDQEESKEELFFLKDIGIKMGLSPDATEKVLSKMHEYHNKVIPAEVLIAIFKGQYN